MTLAQITAIIALLSAFNVPLSTIQEVESILLPTTKVENTLRVEQQPQKLPMQTLKVIHTITGPHSKEDKTVHVTFSVIALEDKRQIMDEDIIFIAPDGSEKTVATSVIGRIIKHDATMHKGSQFHWDLPIGEKQSFIFKWGNVEETVELINE